MVASFKMLLSFQGSVPKKYLNRIISFLKEKENEDTLENIKLFFTLSLTPRSK